VVFAAVRERHGGQDVDEIRGRFTERRAVNAAIVARAKSQSVVVGWIAWTKCYMMRNIKGSLQISVFGQMRLVWLTIRNQISNNTLVLSRPFPADKSKSTQMGTTVVNPFLQLRFGHTAAAVSSFGEH
jgi:hypothetical protein